MIHQQQIAVQTHGFGLYEITEPLRDILSKSGLRDGLLSVYCMHTSCSLVIMENADPSARRDLERWLNRLVPVDDPDFAHTVEGPDDMPAHIKMVITGTSETLPVRHGEMVRGTWQGIFLWEHRASSRTRDLFVTLLGE